METSVNTTGRLSGARPQEPGHTALIQKHGLMHTKQTQLLPGLGLLLGESGNTLLLASPELFNLERRRIFLYFKLIPKYVTLVFT